MTSTIKVNNIQNQCGANIINENSNTITIGASGDTIALASGASQSGFGREGSVNWQTGSLKTSTFTAASGEGYFINQGSAITMNLPAGSAGAIVAVSDYARNFATYNLTVSPNGSEKIGGVAADATLNVNGQAATFVYVDSTKGWINVQNAEDTETGVGFISATGGTVSCSGNFKIHTFTGPGTFCVSQLASCSANNEVDYLVVAGGGGTGGLACQTGGGGAGGFRLSNSTCMPAPTTSPLANPTGITVTATAFPITVGAGGSPVPAPGTSNPGSNSVFSTITSAGGGGGRCASPVNKGQSGGSGGGGRNEAGASGNTPPVSPPQGNNGGSGDHSGPQYGSGGGGGAGGVGGNGNSSDSGDGGIGSFVVSAGFAGCNGTPGPVGSTRYFAGGGGGGSENNGGTGGAGGGGAGTDNSGNAVAGTANTGGGAGSGGDSNATGAAGGSGIVIIRYRFQ